jgi:cation diffusion facilitator CzcD-associated flavoprotein CzcO
MLGIKSLIVDREERIGDNWRSRYHQLVLHDPVWFDHLPYLPFPESWPVFTPKVPMLLKLQALLILVSETILTISHIG